MNRKIIALILISCSCIFVGTPAFATTNNPSSVTKSPQIISTNRLFGDTRYETARVISEYYGNRKVKNLILSTGNGFTDAVSASVLAHQKDAPILLVDTSVERSKDAFDYVTQHLDPTGTIYIIGGTGIIGTEFETKLNDLGFENIIRIAGIDRYDTSYEIASSLDDVNVSTVVISSGEQYPDAISISGFAANKGWPILLSSHDALPQEMKKFLLERKPSEVYIAGGVGVISDYVKSEISSLLPQANIERLAGQSRFDTNAVIAEKFAPNPSTIYVTTGYGFADALAGSAVAAKNGDPIIFTDPSVSTLPKSVAGYFGKLYASNLSLNLVSFGGNGVVKDEVIKNSSDLILGTVKENSIYSIDDITATVTQKENYSLPTTVQAKLYNSDTIDVPVQWNPKLVNTASIGSSVYDGVVDGYGKAIKLNLTVKEPIVETDITISGRSATLINVKTGATLFSKNPTNQEYPASITKLMTALLVYQSGIPLTNSIEIGDAVQDSFLIDTTLMGLQQGDSITLGDLLTATLLGSYNDGANALAQATTGSVDSFVDAMNTEASVLGMKNTHFANPSGLTESNHYTTAEDMAVMARFIVTKYPQILDITARSSMPVSVNGNQRTIKNINHIIDDDNNILGLKTGYTHAADNTIIALEKVGDREVIAVILKSPGYALYRDAEKLLDAGIDLDSQND